MTSKHEIKAMNVNGLPIGIVDIEYGINDMIKWVLVGSDGKQSAVHTSMVRNDRNDRAYFIAYRQKIYLDECVRRDSPWGGW